MIIELIPRGMNLKEKTIWAARQKIILKIQFLTGDRWEIYGAASIGFFSNSANWGTWNLDSLPAYSYCSSGHILILHTYVHLWTVCCMLQWWWWCSGCPLSHVYALWCCLQWCNMSCWEVALLISLDSLINRGHFVSHYLEQEQLLIERPSLTPRFLPRVAAAAEIQNS